jgi:hypothetical protein
VLVFNCDEGIDFHSMGRIFTGLVKSGAWGCFDEFNRLKEDQLSAVSQQIQVIQVRSTNHVYYYSPLPLPLRSLSCTCSLFIPFCVTIFLGCNQAQGRVM